MKIKRKRIFNLFLNSRRIPNRYKLSVWFKQTIAIETILVDISLIVLSFTIWILSSKIKGLLGDKISDSGFSLILIAGIAMVVRIVILVFVRNLKKGQNIQQYAENSIRSRSYSESIRFISYRIWLSAEKWENEFHKIGIDVISILYLGEGNDILKERLTQIKEKTSKLYDDLIFIHFAMQELGAKMLINPRMVSDYLFLFSPRIYFSEIQTTIEKIDEIVNHLSASNTEILELFDFEIGKRESFLRKIKEDQERLHTFSELHDPLYRLSRGFGVSSSFSIYFRGIIDIHSEFLKSNKENSKEIFQEKIRFWYSRRKFSGMYDLHALLLNYFRSQSDDILSGYLGSGIFAPGKYYKGGFIEPPKTLGSSYNGFVKIRSREREAIREKVKAIFEEKLKNEKYSRLIIVTQGFSSLVNSTIEELLPFLSSMKIKYNLVSRPVLHLLRSSKKLDANYLNTTRFINYKYKINPNIYRESDRNVVVKIGSLDGVFKEYAENKNLILLLSGAELVLKKKDKVQFVNSEGIKDKQLEQLGTESKFHLILAESFKIVKLGEVGLALTEDDNCKDIFEESLNLMHSDHSKLHEWSKGKILISNIEFF